MIDIFIQIKATILFFHLNLFRDYEEELMVAYLPHNRCSKFSGTSSAQLPMALSIPIIFSHMYTLGRIPALRQRGVYFFILSRTTEVLWASHKACHIPKRPENLPMAVTCKRVTDRPPVRLSGDTSSMKVLILGVILSLLMLLYSKKDAIPWIFHQGSLLLAVGELGKKQTQEVAGPAKVGRVYGQRVSAGMERGWMLPSEKQISFYCHKQLRNCCPPFFLVMITLDVSVRQGLPVSLNAERDLGDTLP